MTTEDKKATRREEILTGALQAFSEKGYDKTSMDDIVQASGLSKGTIYWHFKNKEAVFAGLLDWVTQQLIDAFNQVVTEAEDLPPVEAVRLLYTSTYQYIRSAPNASSLFIDFMLQAIHQDAVRDRLLVYYEFYISKLAEFIQHGIDQGTFRQVDAKAAAASIMGELDGIGLQAVFGESLGMYQQHGLSLESVIETAADKTIAGLKKGADDD